ncbi:peptidase S28 [Amylostereum chailletii]|nr:peptidase S28 [Amylostereum chailletii]
MPPPPVPPIVPPSELDEQALVVHAATQAVLPALNTTYYFDQLIDHNNASLGTFKQRYWTTWNYYETGGPIILFTPGELNAETFTGYLTNRTINGQMAQQHNGATIVLEHRFYGQSNPLPDLSVESFQYHTIHQAVEDIEYFAKNVKLPMPGGDQVAPGQAPWIMVGGSYSGVLTAYTMEKKPGLFQAGYASSAPVQNIFNFWRYFEPIREGMPKNCSNDVQAALAAFDSTVSNATAFKALQDQFGMGAVTHQDDVTGALRINLWTWQELNPSDGPGTKFFKFCDALEVDKDGAIAPEAGFGAEHALAAWAAYFKNTTLPNYCGNVDAETCLGSYDGTLDYWTNTSVDNAGRSWSWIVCNEVGFLQDTAPDDQPSLVSRIVTVAGDQRQCQLMFPKAFPTPPVAKVDVTNAAYGGWNISVDRLFFANAQRDPWRDATVSAEGLTPSGTPAENIGVSDAFHCSDLLTRNTVDATVLAVQQKGLAQVKKWVAEWQPTAAKRELAPARVGVVSKDA